MFLAIFQLPDANALRTHDLLMEKMQELSSSFPDGVRWEVAFDTTPYTRESINEVFNTLRDAIGFSSDRGAGVPAELALGDYSVGGRAGGHYRHVRSDGGISVSA